MTKCYHILSEKKKAKNGITLTFNCNLGVHNFSETNNLIIIGFGFSEVSSLYLDHSPPTGLLPWVITLLTHLFFHFLETDPPGEFSRQRTGYLCSSGVKNHRAPPIFI
jgi:hypothetical protein